MGEPEYRRTGDLVWHAFGVVMFVAFAALGYFYVSGFWGTLMALGFGVCALDSLGDVRDELNKPKARYVIERERDHG